MQPIAPFERLTGRQNFSTCLERNQAVLILNPTSMPIKNVHDDHFFNHRCP